jgi:hypothetical protein
MSYPVLLGAVVVVVGANRIRWREVATTNNADIAAGTYFLRGDGAADDLCLAIKTAIEAAGASANTYSVVAARSLTPTASHTLVTITRLTGADNFGMVVDGTETFDCDLIGFVASTATNSTAKTGTRAAAASWASNDAYQRLKPFSSTPATVTRVASGRVSGVTRGSRMQSWRVAFGFVHESRCNVVDGLNGAADTLEGFIERHGAGALLELHEVTASGAVIALPTSSTLKDRVHFSQESIEEWDPQQIGDAVPLYDVALVMHSEAV